MRIILLIFLVPIIFFKSLGQSTIQVKIPSAKSEADYIWSTLMDIDFFESHNYQVNLPVGSFIQTLKEKSKAKLLSDSDYEALRSYIKDSVYKVNDYKKGHEKVLKQVSFVEQLINEIDETQFDWNFKKFSTYTVNLTFYGPGGSFDPEEGSIILFTTKDGHFKNYANPANTMIHEIIHIGIERSIISKHQVPHSLKERIVDTFVMLNLKPNYLNTRFRISVIIALIDI